MEKKPNNAIFVVLGIVLIVCILCTCLSAIGYFLYLGSKEKTNINVQNTNENEFTEIMTDYVQKIDKLQDKWDLSDSKCNQYEKRGELMDGLFTIEQFNEVVIESKKSLDEEWACYKPIWQEEYDLISNFIDKFSNIYCTEIDIDDSDCIDFVSELESQKYNLDELLPLIDEDYEKLKKLYDCYNKAFSDYYSSDQSVLDAGYEACDNIYESSYDNRIEEIKDEVSESWDRTYYIAEDYLE